MARVESVVALMLAIAGLCGPAQPVTGLPGLAHPAAAPVGHALDEGAGIAMAARPADRGIGAGPASVRLPGVSGTPGPVAIELPTVGSHASIVPVDVRPNGQLTVPDDPKVVGWWRSGDPALVLDGHIDSAVAGIGALFRLAALTPGDPLTLTAADGARHPFVVTSVRSYAKRALPPEVFTTPGELVLISCGGRFDRTIRQYTDNIVVRARPA